MEVTSLGHRPSGSPIDPVQLSSLCCKFAVNLLGAERLHSICNYYIITTNFCSGNPVKKQEKKRAPSIRVAAFIVQSIIMLPNVKKGCLSPTFDAQVVYPNHVFQ
ncbi:hypothetical protein VNO77_36689 [Canavalia gladiata]|uniref:Uncharacterized protein n=1 Tax=Canavalia gladiata TaxID=3824 RepID=A0AAN9K9I4_CANGL